MFRFLDVLAHAGEEHSDSLDTVTHAVSPWYVAVPLFLLVVAGIGYLTWLLSGRKPDTVLIVLSIVLLISGFTLFNISPFISVISITVGILMAGILTFGGLAEDAKNDKK